MNNGEIDIFLVDSDFFLYLFDLFVLNENLTFFSFKYAFNFNNVSFILNWANTLVFKKIYYYYYYKNISLVAGFFLLID